VAAAQPQLAHMQAAGGGSMLLGQQQGRQGGAGLLGEGWPTWRSGRRRCATDLALAHHGQACILQWPSDLCGSMYRHTCHRPCPHPHIPPFVAGLFLGWDCIPRRLSGLCCPTCVCVCPARALRLLSGMPPGSLSACNECVQ